MCNTRALQDPYASGSQPSWSGRVRDSAGTVLRVLTNANSLQLELERT